MRLDVGQNQQISRGLAGGIWTSWIKRCVFAEGAARPKAAVNFIGGNLNELRYLTLARFFQ